MFPIPCGARIAPVALFTEETLILARVPSLSLFWLACDGNDDFDAERLKRLGRWKAGVEEIFGF